jgi:hypothetical protein
MVACLHHQQGEAAAAADATHIEGSTTIGLRPVVQLSRGQAMDRRRYSPACSSLGRKTQALTWGRLGLGS